MRSLLSLLRFALKALGLLTQSSRGLKPTLATQLGVLGCDLLVALLGRCERWARERLDERLENDAVLGCDGPGGWRLQLLVAALGHHPNLLVGRQERRALGMGDPLGEVLRLLFRQCDRLGVLSRGGYKRLRELVVGLRWRAEVDGETLRLKVSEERLEPRGRPP